MRNAGSFVVTMMLAALPLYACAGSEAVDTDAGTPTPADDGGTTPAVTSAQLRSNVRDAFVAEAEWMRIYGASAMQQGPDVQAAFSRLSQTEAQIVEQIAPFTDAASADQLASLLHARADAFAALVSAMASEGSTRVGDPQAALDANAQAIGRFIANLCPNAFSMNAVDDLKTADRSMVAGLDARASNDAASAVADFDAAQVAAANFADAVGAAISTTFSAQLAPATTSLVVDGLAMRLSMVLDDQAFWTRAYAVDQLHNLTAQPELDRAVKASVDLGQIFSIYFGQDVGTQIQVYMHADTTDAIAYLLALESGDQSSVDTLGAQWDEDMATLSQYLASTTGVDANAVQSMLRTSADRERAMLVARTQSQWDADASDYENVVDDRDALATAVASAIGVKTQPAH